MSWRKAVLAMEELKENALEVLKRDENNKLACLSIIAVKMFYEQYTTVIEDERLVRADSDFSGTVYGAVKFSMANEERTINNFLSLLPGEAWNKTNNIPRLPAVQYLEKGYCKYRKLNEIDSLIFGSDKDDEIIFDRRRNSKDFEKTGLFSKLFSKENEEKL
ncbi:hypothetical protein [Eubacterium callanderi]|uniref:Uncharacterized protein n=1 Tax=Eubacterium callanderi TaxID=53442 RepID=E3GEJ3_9FIRM|nr:hypothetical protein [Eubacterium callanderi]OEZ05775.1 hypothetical protein BUME_08720 [[Butyribacterium] methylotrophicum]ADO38109.1 hypothetical protein ELI_3140 [Eubacterium callanderi]MCB6660126.1 hypothetical protein [Eubacterium callanderi]MCB6753081.1 hypothetical protein [Eubacterium callanderi]MCB7104761.1 hypothetical protein [Eubacterium callanderi]